MATLRDEREPRFGEITDALALRQAIEQARATVLRFASAFSAQKFKSAPYLVKVPLVRSGPQGEVCVWSAEVASEHPTPELHLWLQVHDALDDLFFAHVVEAPENFGLTAGDTYVVTADQIEDWMINVDGLVYGAYTLRLQRDALPESARAEFDNYVGVHGFSAELP
jgi:uncharacterized protein YegJ (DUF2314 family)